MNIFKEKGAALLEFALITPLLLLLLFGIIEFGIMLYNQQVITNASREAARYGIVSASPRKSPTEIEGIADNYCLGRLITFGTANTPVCIIEPIDKDVVPNILIPTTDATFGDELNIRVSYNYSFLLVPAFLGDWVGDQTLTAQTVMRYE